MPLSRFAGSTALLDDRVALQRRYEADGYLYLPGALDPAAVARVRDEFVRVLVAQGVAEPGAPDPLAVAGATIDAVDDGALYACPGYLELCASAPMTALLERVFGEPVFVFRGTNIRYALPGDDLHTTPPHQDHFFVGPGDDFRTVWIPLVRIGESAGGLAVARASHRGGLRAHVEHDEAESYVFRGRKQRGVPLDDVAEEWLTADYEPGDVLVFHSHTVHRALPNRSRQVRLSLDARAQPARTPATFQARCTIPELRRYRRDAAAAAQQLGVDDALFEAVLAEMMRRGTAPDRAGVEGIAAEIAGAR